MKYSIRTIKTDVISAPKDDLLKHIRNSALTLKEGDIVAVTSKVVGIWEGRTVPIGSIEKDELIKRESKLWLPRNMVFGGYAMHTITHGFLISSAGIDESNGNGYYILYPKNPQRSALNLLKFFQKEYGVQKIGVIVTDSHSTPLRRGVTGFSLAHAGFEPLVDYRGQKDIFGRPYHFSQSNVPDALAASAVLAMGEGNEQTPLAIIRGTSYALLIKGKSKRKWSKFNIPISKDIFGVFLNKMPWRKGGSH
jgi:F420-0:gamma-glutamyl ligase